MTSIKNQFKVMSPSDECNKPFVILYITAIAILIYYVLMGLYHSPPDKDPLNYKALELKWLENCCSWWPITHFIVFFILGYYYPKCESMLFILGLGWEIFEMTTRYLLNLKSTPVVSEGNIEYSGHWFAGSCKDILFNTVGIVLGKKLRQYHDRK